MTPQERPLGSWADVEEVLRESESRAIAGQYSAAIMHEINNPLESIVNLAFLIEREAEDAEEVRRYTLLLQSEVADVIRIARQTLSFFTPSHARRSADLVTLIESAIKVHERRISKRDIRITRDFGGAASMEVHPGEMLQVFGNLIGNALDALPDHGCLRIGIRKSRDRVSVTIADNGVGIPQNLSTRIFEPFFTTKQETGTGLGLPISRSIVEGHQGTIRVRSSTRSGQSGTTFRITLPVKPE